MDLNKHKNIVEERMKMPFKDYVQKCIDRLDTLSDKGILNGIGELLDDKTKKDIRHKLRPETITLLNFYKEFPIIAN